MKTPKYFIWEPICYKDDLLVIFWRVESITIINWREISYWFWWRLFLEKEVMSAVLEARDKKSKFYNIYPF